MPGGERGGGGGGERGGGGGGGGGTRGLPRQLQGHLVVQQIYSCALYYSTTCIYFKLHIKCALTPLVLPNIAHRKV